MAKRPANQELNITADSWEHDSAVDAEIAMPVNLAGKPEKLPSPQAVRREAMPKDQPWLHENNPAIWEGDIGDDGTHIQII